VARLNLSDAVEDLMPAQPPCYQNRYSWREYLKSAAAAQNQRDEPKVILIRGGEPIFNYAFPYCADCTDARRIEMQRASRCNPEFLMQQLDGGDDHELAIGN
jgi:hypothetical protein